MWLKRWLVLVLLVLGLVACGSAAEQSTESRGAAADDSMSEPEVAEEMAEAPAENSAADMDTGAGGEAAPDVQAQPFDRQIIYTAGLQIRVDDPRGTARALSSLARRYGGFVSGSEVYEIGFDEQRQFRADVQLRIPAEQYEAALEELRGLGEVLQENSSSEDVTSEYVDLQARVDNLTRTEAEIQALLDEARSRGDSMEDILRIYNELTSIRSEIEAYQGRLNVLSNLVSLSTINAELVPPELDTPISILSEPWRPSETVRAALNTLISGMQVLIDFLIYAVIVLVPYLLVLGVVGFVVYTLLRRLLGRRGDRRSPAPEPPSATPPQS